MRLSPSLLICALSALSGLLLPGCSWQKKESDLGRNSVKVQIPFQVDGNYQLGVVELFTLKNVTTLKGLAARFLIDPETRGGQLTGRMPEVRYIRDQDDVIVAKDSLSLQLLTVYHRFEKLKELDEKTNAAGVLTYPRPVAVNARMVRADGSIEENNAVYSGQYDALMVEAYTQDQLPLMANMGVIGHEHFHALFHKLVIAPLKAKGKYPKDDEDTTHNEKAKLRSMGLVPAEKIARWDRASGEPPHPPKDEKEAREIYHGVLFRAINEGLADVWGWIFSGDDYFVGRSLPQQKVDRDLVEKTETLKTKSFLMDNVMSGQYTKQGLIDAFAYKMGIPLGRAIRNFAHKYQARKKIPSEQVRVEIGQILIKLLPEIQKKFEAMKEDEYLTLGQVAALFGQQVSDISEDECNYLGKKLPQEDRESTQFPTYCKKFQQEPAEALWER